MTARATFRWWSVWAVALMLYTIAVFHRSSLAVAGIAASERFSITSAQLSAFVMVQLMVYAAMQVPVGLAIDRFGPRRVMATGAVLAAAGKSSLHYRRAMNCHFSLVSLLVSAML